MGHAAGPADRRLSAPRPDWEELFWVPCGAVGLGRGAGRLREQRGDWDGSDAPSGWGQVEDN